MLQCAWLRHLVEAATASQPVYTNKVSVFTLSIKNGHWVCLLFLYVQMFRDHLFRNVCSEFWKNGCYNFKLCFFFFNNYGNLMIHVCVKDQPIFLRVKLSGCCPSLWPFQLVLCEFQTSSSQRRQRI